MISIWTSGILTTRWRHLALSAVGIVAATALIGVVGAFGVSSGRTMTTRALAAVPADWQIALAAGADQPALPARLRQTPPLPAPGIRGPGRLAAFCPAHGRRRQRP